MNWDGIYNTNERESGAQGQWASPGTLLVAWGKNVQYRGIAIAKAKFFNNSSVSWTGDPKWGSGQIWFTYGDNRSYYWPDGAVKGRAFVGWIKSGSESPVDLRGENKSAYQDDLKGCIGSCPNQADSCEGGCSNGRICSRGNCVCPSGTTDCNGQCIASAPCGGCTNGKICSGGKCVCPSGTKECNDQCIPIAECCDGCPPWKTCNNGECGCPAGIKECPDPLPF
jgi:hypothetical protein